ncbi:hypothetical protein EZS27_007407 [termite gut metagenome]|uniref:RelA/SpoT domain-containing protein n=1 Tax=termite gut metagenome TaxID=433724 RepID=A0A5J4SGS3_9ZZZZ
MEDSTIEEFINQSILDTIKTDYLDSQEELHLELNKILKEFNDNNFLEKVYALKYRIKDTEHLIAKIKRKYKENYKKYRDISKENYKSIITDLIGIRIIILGKEDWSKVHDFLTARFKNEERNYSAINNKTRCIIEKPVIHTTDGDDDYLYNKFKGTLEIKPSLQGYRSIHYVVKYEKHICEIQVRTIFDEGWLEFDHEIKYPNDATNIVKGDFLLQMSRMAKISQDMISFYRKHSQIFEKKQEIKRFMLKRINDDKIEELGNFEERVNQFINKEL